MFSFKPEKSRFIPPLLKIPTLANTPFLKKCLHLTGTILDQLVSAQFAANVQKSSNIFSLKTKDLVQVFHQIFESIYPNVSVHILVSKCTWF